MDRHAPAAFARHAARLRILSVSIVDLGSTNGLYVNGQRVQQAQLDDGGVVKVGNTSMTVRFVSSQEDGSNV